MGKKKRKKTAQPEKQHSFWEKLYRENYKKLLWVSVIIVLLSIGVTLGKVITTGDFAEKGVSLKGGIVLTVLTETPVDVEATLAELRTELPSIDANIKTTSSRGQQESIIIEASGVESDELILAVQGMIPAANDRDNVSIDTTDPVLGRIAFNQTMLAILVAFVFMAIVVFLYFRSLVPSAAIILAALSDMLFALAGLNLLGIKLSLAGVAAFLMLIGYSVDTDILLSVRVIKRKEGTVFDRVVGAMKTGLTMSAATLAVVIVALIFTDSEIIRQIMTVLLFGLIGDIIFTWIQNAGILRIYTEKKGQT